MSTRDLVAPGQAELNLDGSDLLSIENDVNGWAQTYSCQTMVEENYVTPIEVSFYYDLLFLGDATTSRQEFEYLLLKKIANEFGLESGDACIFPSADYNVYPVMLSSLPEDVPNENLSNCINLAPNAEQDCISYAGKITGYVAGVDDTTELIDFMATAMSHGSVTVGTTMEVSFLGTQIQNNEPRDALNAAVNAIEQPAQPKENNFTSVGVLLTVALCMAFVGLFLVIWKMRRRRHQYWREEVVMATRSQDDIPVEYEVPPTQYGIEKFDPLESPRQYGIDNADLVSDGAFPEDQKEFTFDLGDRIKNELLGIHGGGGGGQRIMPGVAPPASDSSEDDSWAQPDATLASLDGGLNVITGETAEI